MPLFKGKKNLSRNVGELMHSFKESGNIGNTKPMSTEHAREIASAIAYRMARGKGKGAKRRGLKKGLSGGKP